MYIYKKVIKKCQKPEKFAFRNNIKRHWCVVRHIEVEAIGKKSK